MANQTDFNCSQEELILVANKGWESCLAKRDPFFVNFKPKYTTLFITGKVTAVTAADDLPNEQQRLDAQETARVNLVAINKAGCQKWQTLKRYIADAFPENVVQIKWNAAGMTNYEEATHENWESVKDLMRMGNKFITDNLTTLTANDNMPSAFQATFSTAKTATGDALTAFLAAESNSVTGAQTKVDALNAVHSDLMSMFLDGQEIFADNVALKKQFTFEQVLALVSGTGPQGFKGTITNTLDNSPIENALVTVQGTSHSTNSDAAGNYAMRNIAHNDNYKLTITHPDFVTQTIPDQSVAVGVMTTLDIQLRPNP